MSHAKHEPSMPAPQLTDAEVHTINTVLVGTYAVMHSMRHEAVLCLVTALMANCCVQVARSREGAVNLLMGEMADRAMQGITKVAEANKIT